METSRIKYKSLILKIVATSALITVAMIAPNALQLLKISDRRKQQQSNYKLNNSLYSLLKNGHIKFVENKSGKKYLSLTPRGRLEFLKYQKVSFMKPKIWDKHWRVVIFDIPEQKRRLRDIVRFHLKKIGFIQLQKSVWVFPYDCEEIILLLKTNFKFGKEVLYMKVQLIENDRAIRQHYFPKK